MDSNQDFGSVLNNFSNSSQPQQSNDSFGRVLSGYGRSSQQAPADPANIDEFVKSVAPAAQRVASKLGVPVEAVIGQWGLETGWGRSVIPGTNNLGNIKSTDGRGVAATDNQTGSRDKYRQYESTDHFADDFSNLVGGGRYRGVPGAKDATSYFQGLKAGGYAEDAAYVQKGTQAAQLAAEAMGRSGVVKTQQPQGPDLSKAPKWADVEAKPEFAALPPEKKSEAKAAYFDYWIAPRAGDRRDELRQKFLAVEKPQDRSLLQATGDTLQNLAAGVLKIGPTALKGAADVGNMLTGDTVDLGVSKTMQEGMDLIDKKVASNNFNRQKKGFEAVMHDDSKGIGDMFAYMLDNPAILVDNTITTIGSMFLPAGAAKGAVAGARAMGAGSAVATKAAVASSIGAAAAQNAGDTFSTLEKQSLEDRYKGAAISAGVSILAGIATGGGAEGQIAKKLAGDLQAGRVGLDAVKQFLKSVGRETVQESGEELGNIGGEMAGSLDVPSAASAGKRTAFAGALGGVMGGGTHMLTGGGAQQTAAPASTTPDGRLDPAMVAPVATPEEAGAPAIHPTSQTADDIVRSLAEEHGVPLDTVLPSVAPSIEKNSTDSRVLDFASTRYRQLSEKAADEGGLSPTEQQELDVLQNNRGDSAALGVFYGFDQPTTNLESQNAPSEGQAQEPGLTPSQDATGSDGQPSGPAPVTQPAGVTEAATTDQQYPVGDTGQQAGTVQAEAPLTVPLSERSDDELRAQLRSASDRGIQRAIGEELARRKKEAKASAPEPVKPPAPPKTKTEKAAKASKEDLEHLFGVPQKREKALARIAKGTAFFGNEAKAKEFITSNGLKDTHEVVKSPKGTRWDIVAKKQHKEEPNGIEAPQAVEATQEGPQTPAAEPVDAKAATPVPEAAPTAEGGLPDAGRTDAVEAAGVKTLSKMLTLKSTTLMRDDGNGRRLYDVAVSPEFRNKHFVNGRMPVVDGLELKPKSDVTGNVYDRGWVLIDNREQLANRRGNDVKQEIGGETGEGSVSNGTLDNPRPVTLPVNKPSEPAHYGTGHRLLTEGGKPFKTERAARIASTLKNGGHVVGDQLRMSNGLTQMRLTPDELAAVPDAVKREAPDPEKARIAPKTEREAIERKTKQVMELVQQLKDAGAPLNITEELTRSRIEAKGLKAADVTIKDLKEMLATVLKTNQAEPELRDPTNREIAAPKGVSAAPGTAGVEAAGVEPEPFTHSGLKVYPIRVRIGEEIAQRWAVQTPDNAERERNGERQIGGDSILETRESAMKEAERLTKQEEGRKELEVHRAKTEREAAEMKAAERQAKADMLGDFYANENRLLRDRAAATLAKQVKEADGTVMTRADWVRKQVEAGAELKTATVDKIKPMSRTQFNRASNAEQRAHEAKVKAGGKVLEYQIGNFVVTKTEYDFAEHLKAKRENVSKKSEKVDMSEQRVEETAKSEQVEPPPQLPNDGRIFGLRPEQLGAKQKGGMSDDGTWYDKDAKEKRDAEEVAARKELVEKQKAENAKRVDDATTDPRIKALQDAGIPDNQLLQAAKELKEGDDSLVKDLARIKGVSLPESKPDFIIKDQAQFSDAPQSLIDRMAKNEKDGTPAMLMLGGGAHGKYTLYEPGNRTHYSHDWRVLQGESSSKDVPKVALRYKSESDIVAMTNAAKSLIDKTAAEIEAQKLADEKARAEREAATAKEQADKAELRNRLESVKFKSEEIPITTDNGVTKNVKAYTYQGAAVHKTHLGEGKKYQITHIKTSKHIGARFDSLSDAKLAAARLAQATNLNEITGKEGIEHPGFMRLVETAQAMRGDTIWVSGNPLNNPELSLSADPYIAPKTEREARARKAVEAEKAKPPSRAVIVEQDDGIGNITVHAQVDLGKGLERGFSGVDSVDNARKMLELQGVPSGAISVRKEVFDPKLKKFVTNKPKTEREAKARKEASKPYLLPEEIAPVAEAFNNLFDTIQTREDASGNVVMFNRKDDNSSDETGIKDNSHDTQRAIEMLERAFGRDYMVSHPVEGWSTDETKAVAPIAQAFGSKVVGYKVRPENKRFDTWDMAGSNGAQAVGHIFLNVESGRPHLSILGHETAHEMRKRRPDLYAKLVNAIESYVDKDKYSNVFRNSKVGRGSLRDGMTPDQVEDSIQEEFIGEVLSDGFMDAGFWRALGQKNKQLLAQVWAFVGKILGKVMGPGGTGYTKRTEQYLNDYAKVMQIAGEVMAEYGMNPSTMAKAMGVPVFNRWVVDLTKTPEFKRWFVDSKVVDKDGKPLLVYHGTGADITQFNVSERGEFGGGIYLTPDTNGASDYAMYRGQGSANVMPVYVSIKNPASAAEASQVASWHGEENAQAELMRRGYDGVIDMRSGQIVAFRPEQIKSAIGNNGQFDPQNPDIRFNRGKTSPVTNPNDVVGNQGGRSADDSTPGAVKDIAAAWDALGIKNAIFEKNGTIELSRIEVPSQNRNAGIGTKAMQQLLDYADATGQRITLTPSSDFGGAKSRLVDFYKRMGFKENKGRSRDFTTRDTMIREPKPNEPTAPASFGAPKFNRKDQREAIANEFGSALFNKFNALHKSVGTQQHKAALDRDFKVTYDLANRMEAMGSLITVRTAEQAPDVLPKALNLVSAAKQLAMGRKASKAAELASQAVWDGTTQGKKVLEGKVWTDAELRQKYNADDAAIKAYRQIRATIDAAISETAAAQVFAMTASYFPRSEREEMRNLFLEKPQDGVDLVHEKLREKIDLAVQVVERLKKKGDTPDVLINQQNGMEDLVDTLERVDQVMQMADQLSKAGYAPLKRFGKYTVTVKETDSLDPTGKPNVVFFERYETKVEAEDAYFAQGARYAGMSDRISIETGMVNEDEHKLYEGMSPEVVALFAEAIGEKATKDAMIKLAVSDHSVLKHRLDRKTIEGYSREYDRVLATFVTSSGRYSARQYFLTDLKKSVQRIKNKDVQAEAQGVMEYVTKGDTTTAEKLSASVSSMAFMWFLGGPTNLGSALVNSLQVLQMLPQHLYKSTKNSNSMAEIGKAYATAFKMAFGKAELSPELRAALKKAEQEGKVDAQEVHHLYNVGIQGVQSWTTDMISRIPGGKHASRRLQAARYRLQAAGVLWGAMFGAVEMMNRRVTFIAAYNVAQKEGMADPFKYAIDAVDETQGVYTKANRPNWARNPAGRSLLTFKMVPTMMIEVMRRNHKYGGPEGKMANMIMLATMILLMGMGGLPFEDDLLDVVDTVAQWNNLNWSGKQAREQWAKDTFGQLGGEAFLSGASAMLPFDIGSRMGMANLVPGTGLLKKSNEGKRERELAELTGVAGSLALQGRDAYDAMAAGRPERAALSLAPSSVRNLAMGLEMASTGEARTLSTGRKTSDVTQGEGAMKAVGLNPQTLAQHGRARFLEQQKVDLAKLVSKEINDTYAEGLATNDDKLQASAMAKLDDWNKKNPDYLIRMNPQTIKAKVKSFTQDADARMVGGAKKAWRGSVQRNIAVEQEE